MMPVVCASGKGEGGRGEFTFLLFFEKNVKLFFLSTAVSPLHKAISVPSLVVALASLVRRVSLAYGKERNPAHVI